MGIVTQPQSVTKALGQTNTFTCVVDEAWVIDGFKRSIDDGSNWTDVTGETGVGTGSCSYGITVSSGQSGYKYKAFGWYEDELENIVPWESDIATLTIPIVETGTLVDSGFESGADGTALNTGTWTVSGLPQNGEYDTAQAKIGTKSAYLRGPSAVAYGGVTTPFSNLTSDGAEMRFWVRVNSMGYRLVEFVDVNQSAYLYWTAGGNLSVRTQKSGNPNGYTTGTYVTIDTYDGSAQWVQYRVVLKFSDNTYRVYKRTATGGSWIEIKYSGATGDIPMYSVNAVTFSSIFKLRAYQNVDVWLDDLRYSNSGITEIEAVMVGVTTNPSSQSKSVGDNVSFSVVATGNPIYYQWERSTDGGSNYSVIAGATLDTYSHTVALSENNYKYRCVVTNGYDSVTSAAATLTLNAVSSVVQVMEANAEVTSDVDTAPIYYVWGDNLEATYIDSGAPTTYYGDDATLKMGATTLDREYHALIKYFEGSLPKGTVDAANLHLHTTPTGACDLRAYPLKTYGTLVDWGQYSAVGTGWSMQGEGAPTWNTRIIDYQTGELGTPRAWQMAGATHANEIDELVYSSLSIASGGGSAYRSFDIGATQMNLWLGDAYSQGVLIKHNAGVGDRYASFPAPGQVNSPVFVVSYSSLAQNQLDERKLSTNTYIYATAYTFSRFSVSDTENGFMGMVWLNNDLRLSVAYVSPDGVIRKLTDNVSPSGERLSFVGYFWGIHYDASTGRYWLACNDRTTRDFWCAYSDSYTLSGWSWSELDTLVTYKSSVIPSNDHLYTVACDTGSNPDRICFFDYNRSVDVFSSVTTLYEPTVATTRTLAIEIAATGDVTTISASGSIADYPEFGEVRIDNETIWYSGKSGNSFIGCARASRGSVAAIHSVGVTIDPNMGIPTYTHVVKDDTRGCFHVMFNQNALWSAQGYNEYMALGYLRYYFPDSVTTAYQDSWRDLSDNELTLPLKPGTLPLVTTNQGPTFGYSLLCNENGDLILTSRRSDPPNKVGGANVTDYAYCKYGQTTFTSTEDTTAHYWGQVVDLGGSDALMVSINNVSVTASPIIQSIRSTSDSGETWSDDSAIQTHEWVVNKAHTSGISERSKVDGKGLLFTQQIGHGAAIYLSTIELQVQPPTGISTELISNQVDLSWTDNSGIEDGFYIQRRYRTTGDWTAYEACTGSPVIANTLTFTDSSLPVGWTSLQYQVAAYKGAQTSTWLESNVLVPVTFIPQITIT